MKELLTGSLADSVTKIFSEKQTNVIEQIVKVGLNLTLKEQQVEHQRQAREPHRWEGGQTDLRRR